MAIDSLGSNQSVTYSQFSATSTSVAAPPQGDGDGGAARVPGGGKFADAIAQALTQVTGGSASAATGSTSAGTGAGGAAQDPKQAEAAFAQSLFTALQSQFGARQGGASGAAEGGHHHHHGGGGGKIAGALQNLAQQIGSGSGASGDGGSSAAGSLQASFNNLLAANGQPGSSAALPQFLQTLAQNLQGAPSSGNVVSTKV